MLQVDSPWVLTSISEIVLISSAIICGALFLRTLYMILATPIVLTTEHLPKDDRHVSVLLPVRDEASRVLRKNLESLLAQSYQQIEIIAVDDRSADETPAILHHYKALNPNRLHLVEGREPPPGWLGKTFALQLAKTAARGEWLATVDADVIFSGHIISASLAFAAKHDLHALSLLPRVLTVTFWEAVVIPVMSWLSLMRVSTTQANRQSSRACFGYGNFILFQRSAHDRIGGFEAYSGDILDDCAIMERLKSHRFTVMVADGSKLMKSRMYYSLREIFLGFGKNSFAALRYSSLRVLGVVFAETLFVFVPHVYLLYQLATQGTSLSPSGVEAAAAVGFFFLTMSLFGLRMKTDARFFLFYLLGHAVALAIIIYSMVRFQVGGGVTWKGRFIQCLKDRGLV